MRGCRLRLWMLVDWCHQGVFCRGHNLDEWVSDASATAGVGHVRCIVRCAVCWLPAAASCI